MPLPSNNLETTVQFDREWCGMTFLSHLVPMGTTIENKSNKFEMGFYCVCVLYCVCVFGVCHMTAPVVRSCLNAHSFHSTYTSKYRNIWTYKLGTISWKRQELLSTFLISPILTSAQKLLEEAHCPTFYIASGIKMPFHILIIPSISKYFIIYFCYVMPSFLLSIAA